MATILRPFTNLLSPGSKQVPTGRLEIDWTHPLTRNLLGCWLPGVSYGVDISRQSPTLVPDTGMPSMAVGQEGPGLKSNVSATALYAPAPPAYSLWTEFSLYWRGYSLGLPGSDGWLMGVDALPASYAKAVINASGQTNWELVFNVGGGPLSLLFPGPILAPGPLSIGGTFVVGLTGPVNGYISGAQVASGVWGAASGPGGSGSNIVINGWPQFAARISNAICYIACFWNRALTAYEMAWLDQQPYSFLISAEGEMPMLGIPSVPPPSILYGHNIGAHYTYQTTPMEY